MTQPKVPPALEQTQMLAAEADSDAVGTRLGTWVVRHREPLHLYLSGELGTGKTTIARALLRALGVTGRIKSPSYALVEPYVVDLAPALGFKNDLRLYCYHFDFYRFSQPREWLDAGFREYFDDRALCLVEWPERASGEGALPVPDLHFSLAVSGEGRELLMQAFTSRGIQCLTDVVSLRAD